MTEDTNKPQKKSNGKKMEKKEEKSSKSTPNKSADSEDKDNIANDKIKFKEGSRAEKTLDTSTQNSSSTRQSGERLFFLIAFIITWIAIIGGGTYVYDQFNKQPAVQTLNIDELNDRIAQLEKLQNRSKPTPVISKTATRALEMNQYTANRLTKLENIVNSLPDELPVGKIEISDDLVNQKELLEILTRVQQLEENTSKLEKSESIDSSINPMIIGIFNLRDHVMKGLPYQTDVKLLRDLNKNDTDIASYLNTLESLLKKDIPSISTLKVQFDSIAQKIYTSSIGKDDSLWEKTKSLLAKAITIRKIDETLDGNSVEAILSRAEIYLAKGENISYVVSELKQLKGKSLSIANKWIKEAQKFKSLEDIFGKIYDKITHLSAKQFKKDTTKSPNPVFKPTQDNSTDPNQNNQLNNNDLNPLSEGSNYNQILMIKPLEENLILEPL